MNRPTHVGVTSKTGYSQNLTHIATAWAGGGTHSHTTARPARASVPRRVGPAFKHCRASFRRSTSAHTNKQAVLNRHRTELGREFRHRQVRTSLKTVLAHISHEPGPLAKLFNQTSSSRASHTSACCRPHQQAGAACARLCAECTHGHQDHQLQTLPTVE